MTKYLSYFCLIFLCACASTEKKAPEVKTYSDDTNRTFEMIERGGSYYLKKAPEQSVPTPQIKRPERRQPPLYHHQRRQEPITLLKARDHVLRATKKLSLMKKSILLKLKLKLQGLRKKNLRRAMLTLRRMSA